MNDITTSALYFLTLLGIILLLYVLIRLIRLEHRLKNLDLTLTQLNDQPKVKK